MRVASIVLMFLLSLVGPALADDWTVTKLRGDAQEMVDGAWQPLARGDVVPDDRLVRTLVGRMTLVRGAEVIDLGSGTQIQIVDKQGRRPFTTVRQYSGRLEVEAEVENVEHFAVQTPYLVAIVKGTHFIVRSSRTGSDVLVRRGAVSVTDLASKLNVVVSAGQSALAEGGALSVDGRGDLPAVLDGSGQPAGPAGVVGAVGSTVGHVTSAAGGVVNEVTETAGEVVHELNSTAAAAVTKTTNTVTGIVHSVGLGSLLN